jgi:hypothetical protein
VTDGDGKPVLTSIVTMFGEATSTDAEVSAQIAAGRDAAMKRMIAGQNK